MALFRKSRRHRPPASTQAAEGWQSAPRSATAGDALRAHLGEIAGQARVPEDALEPALKAVLEAARAQAGAICVFDPRHAILRLVSEVGLSDEGCRRLRSIRRSDPSVWDMPLQGLLNRRAYLIESAARNRYVPRLVEHASAVRTIACLPLYAGPTPVGSLILIALAPRSLGEPDIRLLERGVGQLAEMIEAVRRRGATTDEAPAAPRAHPRPVVETAAVLAERERLRGEVTARLAERAVLTAELTARSGETDRVRAALDAASIERTRLATELERLRREAERAEATAAALEAAERERARLAAALEAAAADRTQRARAEAALEQTRAAAEHAAVTAKVELEEFRRTAIASDSEAAARAAQLELEIERLRAEGARSEASLTRERAAGRERDQERERLAYELRAATEREQRLRQDLEAVSGRADAGREDAVRHALETVRRAEEARAAAAEEAAAARAALASAHEIVLALEDEAARANAEMERLAAAGRVTSVEHERLEIAIAEGRARELAATARVADLVRETDGLRQEGARLASAVRDREAELATVAARVESVAAERDRLRDSLQVTQAEHSHVDTDAAAATDARRALEESLARETAERARLTAALGAAQAALAELEATLSRREAEAAAQAVEIERLRSERERVAAPAEPIIVPPPAEHPREPVRVVTVGAPGSARTRARDAEPGRGPVAIFDVDAAWSRVMLPGRQLTVLAPADDVAEQLLALSPSRLVVNLAATGALSALTAIRAAGSGARFWGCIADPAGDRALPLGMVEPVPSLADPDAIVEALGRYAVRGTRVVTAGADVDALMSLRQALARGGISVSMAWDAKQATDLLAVVRPEVVVVDLALPRRDGYSIVARLATVDPAPSALIVPGPEDPATGFAAMLGDTTHAGRMLTLTQVLAAALERSEAPPVEKKAQKVRLMGRK